MDAKRSAVTSERAVLASTPTQRHIMESHRLMAQSSEHITRMTTKAAGIELTEEWSHYPECDMTKIPRHAAPKKTTSRASTRAALL